MTDFTRQEVDAKLAQNKAEVDVRLADFETSVKTGFAELRAEFSGLRAEMAKQTGALATEMANVRAEMHRGTADLLKWGVGIAFTAVAATVGLLTYIGKSADKLPAAPPSPIVIYAQPAPAAQPSTATPQK